ncbi:putative transcription factor gsfR1 [Trichoderma ghanense]|uniref:Transcription factor gsfR1 n=1 Tax=Trichoderma ghanense TaxID=65468 RepID=A0ABY2GPQ0_9HYPO
MSSSASSTSAGAERRKLRRGTTSCWECKRRKTRCHFEKSGSSACESCERRGCKCVLQHVEERSLVTEAANHSARARHAGDQLDHLEGVVDRLVRQSTLPAQNPLQEKPTNASINDTSRRTRQLQPSSDCRRRLLPKPDHGPAQSSSHFSTHGDLETLNQPTQTSTPHLSSQVVTADAVLLPPHPTNGALRCSSLTLLLQSILPSANVTTRIMHQNKLLMMSMHVFRGLSTDPFRSVAPRQISRLAAPTTTNAEPIDLARRLFQLAICLQQSDRTSEISALCLDRSNSDVAGQYFEAASRYVTSQDSLVVSFVGIETLMLEGLYHISTGNVRLAWLVFRRAIGIAHLMGLHIPQRRRHSKQTPICLATLWFRLIFTERYLSLVLCLPISVRDDSFMEDLIGQEPHEQLERVQAKLTSRIISRDELMRLDPCTNDLTYDHYNETKDIDHALKQAARTLSADWWAFPRLKDAQTNGELKDMTSKVVLQLHHYNLVLLLHLPYVVPRLGDRSAGHGVQDYTSSKLSAMFASRELLARCIIPVSPNRVTSSTRGNTLKIILAALALLLAHLDSHRLGRDNALDHQRPADLLMVERAIQSLETMAQRYDDVLCFSAVRALRRLGDVEATAADNLGYQVWYEPSDMMELECLVRDDKDTVALVFPYVGTIQILRQCHQEDVPTSITGSRVTTEATGLDAELLTSSWAWAGSPLSFWPDLIPTASSLNDTQSAIFDGRDVQNSRNLPRSDVECVDTQTMPRLHLQDLHVFDGI